jgi:steroid Delta-isomerase
VTAFLADYVERFNDSVRTGDFAGIVELYAEDGELAFEGVPVGPFRGRDAIAEAYRVQPPDDQLRVTSVEERPDGLLARFDWLRGGSGTMRVELDGDAIRKLTVSFDPRP